MCIQMTNEIEFYDPKSQASIVLPDIDHVVRPTSSDRVTVPSRVTRHRSTDGEELIRYARIRAES